MAFHLVSHGPKHLRLSCDAGHRFVFNVVTDGGARQICVGDVKWRLGQQPADSLQYLEHASTFALVCAMDFGLL